MRYKHLPIELKAAIKGGMNETSKQQVPGGALPWLNTKHVLTQKSWSSSHFPISRTFFLIFWKFLLATNREEEPKLQEERHASPCPLYKGANKWILAPWQSQPLVYGHCGTSHGGEPQDHCRGNQGDTTALMQGPNAYRSTPGASPFTLHTGAGGVGVTASCNPLLNSSEKPEQPKPSLARARSPTPDSLDTG